MKKGWYILNYHDISWEENLLIRGLGGTFPPDVFRGHLKKLSQHFKLVSVPEGWELFSQNKINQPLLSFWFDDGLSGVRKYAYPLLENYTVKGAMSINSRFTLRKELFWRFKLSLLSQVDGMRFLRSKLRKVGYRQGTSVKTFVRINFSKEIANIIDGLYKDFTNEIFRKDAYRIFDTIDGIRELLDNGWLIANHSASHYPLGEGAHINKLKEQFLECEEDLNQFFDIETRFWVVPFGAKRSERLLEAFDEADDKNRCLVLVGNKVNKFCDRQNRLIYRISVPLCEGNKLIKFLRCISTGYSSISLRRLIIKGSQRLESRQYNTTQKQ